MTFSDHALLPSRQTGTEHCSACEFGNSTPGRRLVDGTAYEIESVDAAAAVVTAPHFEGVLVVPRDHVSGLEQLSPPRRALLLAVLSRETGRTRGKPTVTAHLAALAEPPGSEHHVCFNVVSVEESTND